MSTREEMIDDAKRDAWDEVYGKFQRTYDDARGSLVSDLENALTEMDGLARWGLEGYAHLDAVEQYLTKAEQSLAALRRVVET